MFTFQKVETVHVSKPCMAIPYSEKFVKSGFSDKIINGCNIIFLPNTGILYNTLTNYRNFFYTIQFRGQKQTPL